MEWLEKLISVFSPLRAYEREAWRQELTEIKERGYDAGNYGRLNRRWRAQNRSAEFEDRFDRDTVRARARDLERNSDMMRSILRSYRRNTVGRGFELQARTDNEQLNEQLEELWREWCKSRNCDVTGQQSFNQILRMAVTRKKVDGGIIFKKCYTDDGILPFKLQALEVDELDITVMTPKHAGNKVVGGIEYNQYNRPVGYWIRQYSIDGLMLNKPEYYDKKEIIFYFEKERPSQLREMSDMAATIPRIRDANEFITAVAVKERVAACFAVIVKRMKDFIGGGVGRSGAVGSDGQKKSYDGKNITPGMMMELNNGDEVQVVDPGNSGNDANTHLKMQLRLMAAGQGLSYESVSRDMSETNYSSARQGSIEDELTFAEEIEPLMEQLMDEVYETFVISAVLAGLVTIKDFWRNKRKYMRHEWVLSPKKWIDPLKEANANRIAMETGQKTFKQISAENGKDWKQQIDDMAEVKKYAELQGVDLFERRWNW
ncbi:MAG: phage portal protein [Anaerotignum sp.]|nr:phage portal protein [Anaerotignum sp.]